MNQQEKIKLFLKFLQQENRPANVEESFSELGIPYKNWKYLSDLMSYIQSFGYIKVVSTKDSLTAEILPAGIDYVESLI